MVHVNDQFLIQCDTDSERGTHLTSLRDPVRLSRPHPSWEVHENRSIRYTSAPFPQLTEMKGEQ